MAAKRPYCSRLPWKHVFDQRIEDVELNIPQITTIFPQSYDDVDARRSIVGLQETYHLSIGDLLSGTIREQATDRPLSQQEGLDNAMTAINDGDAEMTLDWLNHVQSHHQPPMNAVDFYLEVGRANSIMHNTTL